MRRAERGCGALSVTGACEGGPVADVGGDELALLFERWVAIDVEVVGVFGIEVVVAPFGLFSY